MDIIIITVCEVIPNPFGDFMNGLLNVPSNGLIAVEENETVLHG
jgi:hypothetical protein